MADASCSRRSLWWPLLVGVLLTIDALGDVAGDALLLFVVKVSRSREKCLIQTTNHHCSCVRGCNIRKQYREQSEAMLLKFGAFAILHTARIRQYHSKATLNITYPFGAINMQILNPLFSSPFSCPFKRRLHLK